MFEDGAGNVFLHSQACVISHQHWKSVFYKLSEQREMAVDSGRIKYSPSTSVRITYNDVQQHK